jgi:hypothetical protein
MQKSPGRISLQIGGNSSDISKGFFGMVIWKFESSQVSQPVRCLEILPSAIQERPANGGILRIGTRSPGSEFGHFRIGIADSLRPIFEIFPFSGDRGRRPGSICTAWPVWHGIVRFADARERVNSSINVMNRSLRPVMGLHLDSRSSRHPV